MKPPFPKLSPTTVLRTAGRLSLLLCCSAALAATPTELLSGYAAQAGAAPLPARGQQFFNTSHGKDWQCTSCHGKSLMLGGRHASTDKAIEPLAPAANAKRFTDSAKAEKWFRRNCKDVLARECTAAEKADVLAWLISLR